MSASRTEAEPAIVVAEFMDAAGVALLAAQHPTLYDENLVDQPEQLAALLADARALIVRNRTQVDASLLASAPSLAVVGRLGVGLDNIDLDECARRSIAVRPATGANADAVAEYAIGAALVLVRGLGLRATAAVAAGEWPRQQAIGSELGGRLLGLVGYGSIARAVAARARVMGMRIAACDPLLAPEDHAWQDVRRCEQLGELLADADVLSLHVPLDAGTRGMLDAKALAQCKQGQVIINTARGGLLDEHALAAELETGRLGGAALDVFADEPPDARLAARLGKTGRVILSPHIAGLTAESAVRVARVVAEAVLAELAGEHRGIQ